MVCGCYGVAMWLIIGPSVSVIWEFSRCFIVQQVKILHNSRTHTHTHTHFSYGIRLYVKHFSVLIEIIFFTACADLDWIQDNKFLWFVVCLLVSKWVCLNLREQCFCNLASSNSITSQMCVWQRVFGRLFSGNSTFDLDDEQMVVSRLLSC